MLRWKYWKKKIVVDRDSAIFNNNEIKYAIISVTIPMIDLIIYLIEVEDIKYYFDIYIDNSNYLINYWINDFLEAIYWINEFSDVPKYGGISPIYHYCLKL